MAKEKLTAEQVKEFKVEESEAEDAWDYRSLAEDIGEAGDMNWAMQLFKKAEELSKESMDYYMLVEAVAYKDFEARNDENIDKDWMRKLLKNAEELAGEEDDLKRILECVEDIIKDKEWELSIKKKISDFEKQIVLDDDVSESNIVFEPGTGPFKIFYERYSAYTNRNEIRKAKIETVESESVETLLQAIENQKFLIMREDDVIDFSLSENLEDTGFDIIYIKDANGSIIYPNDDVIPKPRSEKNSTVVANFQLRHTKNLNDLKYELWDKLQLVERIFFAPVTQVEFLAGWDIDSFETKGTNAIASFMCGKSSLDNIENLIAEKIK
ncbi:MAG: hypothetical protein HN962_00715, partial [Actinobacteria bacterium]|nr:hypothetical protein [Actinomycetota bacterium]